MRRKGACRPGVYVLERREDLDARLEFLLEESLQVEKLLALDLIGQVREPALVQRVNLELQQLPLLLAKFADPLVLVELFGRGRTGLRGLARACGGRRLRLAEKGRDAGVCFWLLCVVGSEFGRLALETAGVHDDVATKTGAVG